MKNLFLLLLTPVFFYACSPQEKPVERPTAHYEISLQVNPANRYITVEGTFTPGTTNQLYDSIGFYLDRNLAIHNFTFDHSLKATIDTAKSDNRFLPNARKVYFHLSEEQKKELSSVHFSYEGALSKLPKMAGNRIGEDWTELGLYYPWFPFSFEQYGTFTYSVDVENLQDYAVFGIGNIAENATQTVLSSSIPTNDIVVCMAKDIEVFKRPIGNHELKIFHSGLTDSLLIQMSKDVTNSLNDFNQWFGNMDTDVSIIHTQRISGGGYARNGGLVLSGIDSEKYGKRTVYYNQFFAHEMAHLWWNKALATTWHDWLNESFAEYSSLMFLRKQFGEEIFDKYISHKGQKIEGTPPIWEFDRNGAEYEVAYQVLYNKGTLLLKELEDKIGVEPFRKLFNKVAGADVSETNHFLTILAEVSNEQTADWFKKLLQTR
ncbi:MAG: M1 family aminopeptidase [Salinivirgaceae bacterium]